MSLPVTITTTGSTFSPKVALASGSTATVTWACPGASITTTGLNPTLSFGSSATRTVYMTVLDSNGYEAIDQVAVFNLGFDHTNDAGTYSLSSSYDYTAQSVSAIEGVRNMAGLQLFMAANIAGLEGTLDFTGLSQLTNIELFGSSVQDIILTGCTALLRLCGEGNKLTALDLNPAGDNAAEIRVAVQQGGALTLAPLNKPILNDYHWCFRDQTVTNMPDLPVALPHVVELWIWGTGQSGTLTVRSDSVNNLQAYSNSYTSADLANQFPAGRAGYVDLHSNSLTSITLTGCSGIGYLDLHSNTFDQATVDSILATADSWSTSGGTLDLSSNTAPSTTGLTHKTNLTNRGWTVTVDAGGGASFTHQDTGHNSSTSATSLAITLSGAVSAGDLLVLAVESGGAGPSHVSVSDTSSNTWTTVGGTGELWYCTNAAAASGGVTITATITGGFYAHQMIADRFTGTAVYSANASTGSSGTLGLNYNSTGCGNLGTVAAGDLVWGAFLCDDTTGNQAYTAGYQTGSSGTVDVIGSQFAGVGRHRPVGLRHQRRQHERHPDLVRRRSRRDRPRRGRVLHLTGSATSFPGGADS